MGIALVAVGLLVSRYICFLFMPEGSIDEDTVSEQASTTTCCLVSWAKVSMVVYECGDREKALLPLIGLAGMDVTFGFGSLFIESILLFAGSRVFSTS
jgi:hypothetical protein